MKKIIASSLTFLCCCSFVYSQDSIPPYLIGKVKYPVLDFHPYMGVIDTDYTAFKYNSEIDYKVVIDIYDKISDSTSLYSPIREVARIYNLSFANGAPQEKIKLAVVVHGWGINAIFNNEAYEKKYGLKNPNLDLIKALKELGVHFYVCGQNLGMFNIPQHDLVPEIEVALSAKNAFIHLDQLGYSYLNVNQD